MADTDLSQAPGAPLLRVRGLGYGYPGRRLFDGLSFDVSPGLGWVLGGDGSGKTTLLRLLGGELPAPPGALEWPDGGADGAADDRARAVFWIDPRADTHARLTVHACYERVRAQHPRLDVALLRELARELALTPHLDKELHMLSTGTRRKVWLAAAFASGAPLTLLDDPLAALDRRSIEVVTELLAEAAGHPRRAWVVAAWAPIDGVPGRWTVDLDVPVAQG